MSETTALRVAGWTLVAVGMWLTFGRPWLRRRRLAAIRKRMESMEQSFRAARADLERRKRERE